MSPKPALPVSALMGPKSFSPQGCPGQPAASLSPTVIPRSLEAALGGGTGHPGLSATTGGPGVYPLPRSRSAPPASLLLLATLELIHLWNNPVLLPGESHGGRTIVGYNPWGHKESDTTERLHFLSFFL